MASLSSASNWWLISSHHHHHRRRRRLSHSDCSTSASSSFFFPSSSFSPDTKIRLSSSKHFLGPIRVLPSDREGREIEEGSGPEPPAADSVKLAFARAQAYKKDKVATSSSKLPSSVEAAQGSQGSAASEDGNGNYKAASTEVPIAVKHAMERAKEYKKKENERTAPSDGSATVSSNADEVQEKISSTKSREDISLEATMKNGPKVSSIDFLGLEFSEKKRYRGSPPGLAPAVETLFEGNLPVEIIVGDQSKFGNATSTSKMMPKEKDDALNVYKPKVSTWGVFPRPSNISKTYGGGRTIQPGEMLETAEDKASKEKQSNELIAMYRSKIGLSIDPKVKAECEKALMEGDKLMDLGRLKEALPFYEKVMKDLVFQSELHGQAALQWSICQDSLRRPNEARVMYEKLQSHPNAQVSKKARQFAFSFQAMEVMKFTSSSFLKKTGYETYFDAFVENKDIYASREEEVNEGSFRQTLPYIVFLLSPIAFVVFVGIRKSFHL